MPLGLKRYQQEGDDHFITFSCHHRNPVKRGLVMEPEDWRWPSCRYDRLEEAIPVLITQT
jgi:hypothetical protein